MRKKESGNEGFSDHYWITNYNTPEEMDNIFNAKEHASYMKALFALQDFEICSVVDLGFGLGFLFEEVLKTFIPYRAHGIEPSKFAYDKVFKSNIKPVESTKLTLENIDLVTWAKKEQKREKIYDLGICTSVFQYLTDDEIKLVLPIIAKRVRYLYFSVPTDKEYKRIFEDFEFKDDYAIARTREKYLKLISPYFSFVSTRLLESKIHFNDSNSPFTDLLFKF